MTILISIITFWASIFLHPFHVSICEIEHDEETKALQVSERVFLDDLEETLNKVYNVRLDVVNPQNKVYLDSLIKDYILSHLEITIDGKQKKRKYIGHEIEQDALWCYIEYYGVKKMKSVSITNTIFFELFDDQNTLIHFKYNGKTISKRLTKTRPTEVFEFE
ncbi:MAG: hypothetical protein L3J29_00095 [Cyclobacteriaceae bacterium]|nr:hypothetical protein [Cyclobacteriaceae bacterium]